MKFYSSGAGLPTTGRHSELQHTTALSGSSCYLSLLYTFVLAERSIRSAESFNRFINPLPASLMQANTRFQTMHRTRNSLSMSLFVVPEQRRFMSPATLAAQSCSVIVDPRAIVCLQ